MAWRAFHFAQSRLRPWLAATAAGALRRAPVVAVAALTIGAAHTEFTAAPAESHGHDAHNPLAVVVDASLPVAARMAAFEAIAKVAVEMQNAAPEAVVSYLGGASPAAIAGAASDLALAVDGDAERRRDALLAALQVLYWTGDAVDEATAAGAGGGSGGGGAAVSPAPPTAGAASTAAAAGAAAAAAAAAPPPTPSAAPSGSVRASASLLQHPSVARVLLAALQQQPSAAKLRRFAVEVLADLVCVPANDVPKHAPQLLPALVQAYRDCGTGGGHADDSATRLDAVGGLAGCVHKQAFPEADYVSSGLVAALFDVLATSKPSSKEPAYAVTAIRELGRIARVGGPLEAELTARDPLRVLTRAVSTAPNVWTKRAAAKACFFLVQNPRLAAASAVSVDQLAVVLEAAGKEDFMAARWARELAKWRQQQAPGAKKKAWWED